jgi:protein-disulfide isomerase
VRFVYKQFPVLGPASDVAARATECAGKQEDFWSLHDWLFANQAVWKASSDVETAIMEAAATLGYDREALTACLGDPAILEAISRDVQETQKFGFQGTPSFMLNGRLIPGFLPWERFASLIEASRAEALGQALPAGYALAPTPPPPDTEFEPEEFAVDGDPDAPVTIVEFSDYQCPYCQRFFQETKTQLDERYIDTGKVRLIYKDFPLDNIHPQARAAASAAECAGAQNAYWAMHDRLFEGKEAWSEQAQAVDIFKGYAADLALDGERFEACMDEELYADEIQADYEEGERAGVTGTPTVTGEFRIRMKVRSQTMYGPGYNLPNVEWVQYFFEDYSFHGTYWHNKFGQPMSHGCVNMTNRDAQWLFEWAGPAFDDEGPTWQRPSEENRGTLVVVHE